MLSFEEFFHKKKIDLTALQAGDPALYEEFFEHYGAMGEKSFDHTKKFWFNKLRKNYLLAAGKPAPVPEKPLAVSDNAIQPTSDVVPVESNASTPKPAGFKPRFKATVAKPKTASDESNNPATAPAEDKLQGEAKVTEAVKPAGFKPRFKAGATKNIAAAENSAEEKEGKETSDTSAPIETNLEETAPTASKPAGFKPRFKAGATKTIAAAEKPAEEKEAKEIPETSTPAESKPEENAPAASKPAGFKPRFKAGVTKPSKPKDDQ